jgi:general stress protein 26
MPSSSKRRVSPPQPVRPHLPASYGIARSSEGLLEWDFVEERMRAARNFWVVTSAREGTPHAMPVWGLWQEGAFYFSTDGRSRKARNIAVRPSVVVHLESGDEVVILEGEARTVSDRPLLERLARDYLAKYAVRLEGGPVFEVKPAQALAWRERDFPSSATRFHFAR